MQILWDKKLIKFSNGSYVAFRLKRKRFIFANKNELELNCAILSYLGSQIETLKKIYAELKAKTQWHKVSEQIPTEEKDYLVKLTDGTIDVMTVALDGDLKPYLLTPKFDFYKDVEKWHEIPKE